MGFLHSISQIRPSLLKNTSNDNFAHAPCRDHIMILAPFNLGDWEIILILALVLTLFAAKRLPELTRGLRLGCDEFAKRLRNLLRKFDGEASDAGRSLGGIYGKTSFQALTPDNQVAELYDPAVLRQKEKLDGAKKKTPGRPLYSILATPRNRMLVSVFVGLASGVLAIMLIHPLLESKSTGALKFIWYSLILTAITLVVSSTVRRLLPAAPEPKARQLRPNTLRG